jgi:hypothetical protein
VDLKLNLKNTRVMSTGEQAHVSIDGKEISTHKLQDLRVSHCKLQPQQRGGQMTNKLGTAAVSKN